MKHRPAPSTAPATAVGSALTRRRFLAQAAAGSALLGAQAAAPRVFAASAAAPAVTSSRPNILVIVTDQQHLRTISGLGDRSLATPNLDRLMARGTCFTQSFSAGTVCCPSRAALLTGRTPCETGVVHNAAARVRDGIANSGQLLAAAGYECYFAGKWHLPMDATWRIPGFKTIGITKNTQGFFRDSHVARACEAFLTARRGGTPFFLNANFMQPHDICQFDSCHVAGLSEDHGCRHIETEFPALPPNLRKFPGGEPASYLRRREKMAHWDDRMWRYQAWAYERMVEQVDAEIGRLLDALDATGLAKNTLVYFTSDHGEGRGRHGFDGKVFLYDAAIRVPTIVSWPGQVAEGKVDAQRLVSGIDLVPTICDYARAKTGVVRGHSLRPALERRAGPARDFITVEMEHARALITARHKYVSFPGENARQLFDLSADPWELTNLALESRHDALRADLHRELVGWEKHLDAVPTGKFPG